MMVSELERLRKGSVCLVSQRETGKGRRYFIPCGRNVRTIRQQGRGAVTLRWAKLVTCGVCLACVPPRLRGGKVRT